MIFHRFHWELSLMTKTIQQWVSTISIPKKDTKADGSILLQTSIIEVHHGLLRHLLLME